jgi:hypothetical protein
VHPLLLEKVPAPHSVQASESPVVPKGEKPALHEHVVGVRELVPAEEVALAGHAAHDDDEAEK